MFEKVENSNQIKDVANLGTAIWHEHYASILSSDQIDYMVEMFQSESAVQKQIEEKNYTYYMMIEEEQPAGYIGFVLEEDSLFLSKLYLAKSFRGRGIATKAFEFLKEIAKESGKSRIWLTVNRYNQDSIHVYVKKGFVKVKEQVTDIGNGYIMDDFVMEMQVGQ
ncbi:MAG TPA: GNAT family N-acetyltransferase [Lachnospiraceae bacterium]|nr:GNAT family N-acetyltransferase [Lachnospiraceae bacterium]